jgi:MFS family permease
MFSAVLRVREFRALWVGETLSVCGDQVARVALMVLVYTRTDSAALTALTYALTFLPALIGMFIGGIADRYPRRAVLVTADVLRTGLAAAMALPGLPLWSLWCLLGALTLVGTSYKAAQQALLPDVLGRELYPAGMGLRQISMQAAQMAGFGFGGVLVAAVGPSPALAGNAATFAVSALLVTTFVRRRPAARSGVKRKDRVRAPVTRELIAVYLFTFEAGLLVAPEGIAAPFAASIGAASVGVGLLMAADPAGCVLGGWWAARTTTRTAVTPAAVASGVPLVLCALASGPWWAMACLAACGAVSTVYLIRLQTVVVDLVPDERRGAVMGRVTACLWAAQGVAITGAGLAAEWIGPARTIAAAGVLGAVTAIVGGLLLRPRSDNATGSVVPATHGPTPSYDEKTVE